MKFLRNRETGVLFVYNPEHASRPVFETVDFDLEMDGVPTPPPLKEQELSMDGVPVPPSLKDIELTMDGVPVPPSLKDSEANIAIKTNATAEKLSKSLRKKNIDN